ncbi:hypothetical protein [Streptomyces sp. NPDC047985]|uniref:hypothetical protein n=1 Tax=Streptomyces sp. NPDC047985 TaxID=3155384 RepID=UPI00344AA9F4
MGTGTSVLTPGDGGHGQAAQEAIHGPAVQTLPTREVFAALGTSPQGLTSAAAVASVRDAGRVIRPLPPGAAARSPIPPAGA